MKDTKTKILDAAKKLIVELGAEKASLRKITAEAGVNIAAINYHFGSKNNLVSAILARFLDPLVDEMTRGLENLVAETGEGELVLEEIIRCFLVPLLEFSLKYPDYENIFVQLSLSYSDENIFRQNIQKVVEENMKSYANCFVRALPGISEQRVLMRMAFFRNTSLGIMKGDCMMEESIAVLGIEMDRDQMMEEMIAYVAAGFRAPVFSSGCRVSGDTELLHSPLS